MGQAIINIGDVPDHTTGGTWSNPANIVNFLLSDTSIIVSYGHYRQYTGAREGQRFLLGQKLAEVGNSGQSSGTHLHIQTMDSSNSTWPTRTTRLKEVYVGINPVADDPWKRLIHDWDIRSGYFFVNAR